MAVDTGSAEVSGVTEVYNVAGAYQFGMSPAEARAATVDGARRVVELAAQLPKATR